MGAFEHIDQCVAELEQVAGEYLDRDKVQRLHVEYLQQRQDSTLLVMLFGSYNAGKSSLVNALLGEELAEFDDIPKTARPDRYEWNGCALLDTPGVNAPIEHEAITEAQIDRSELILFVIREGDQDFKDVYERMFEMLKRGKRIFIVFNYEEQDDLPANLRRLNEIIETYAEQHQIDLREVAMIPKIPLNIETAKKARIKGSEKLAEHAGLSQFEATFRSWLREFDDEHHYLDRVRKLVQQTLAIPLISELEAKMEGDGMAGLQDFQRDRENLIAQYKLFDTRVRNHIRQQVAENKPRIASIMQESASRTDLEAGIQKLAGDIVGSATVYMQELSDAIIADLDSVVSLSVNPIGDDAQGNAFADTAVAAVVEQARNINSDTIKEGLLLLRKLKVPTIKGRWESTLGKWAGKANFVLQAGLAAFQIYQASKAQDEQNTAERRRQMAVYEAVESAARDIAMTVIDSASQVIASAKEQTLNDMDSKIEQLVASAQQHVQDYEHAKRVIARLAAVQI